MTSRGQTRRLSGCKVNTFYLKSDIREREFCAEDDFLVDIHAVFRGIAEEELVVDILLGGDQSGLRELLVVA